MRVPRVVVEYLENSSLHGAKYIIYKDNTIFEKIFWIVCVIIAWCAAGYMMNSSLSTFSNSAISFVVETTYKDWNTNFPAIFVCETSNTENVLKLKEKLWGDDDDFIYEEILNEIAYFKGEIYHTIRECDNLGKTCIGSNYSYYAQAARSPCNRILENCYWNSRPFKCCEQFLPVQTELGVCYAINSKHNSVIQNKKLNMISNKFTGPSAVTMNIKSIANIYVIGEEDVPNLDFPKSEILQIGPYEMTRRFITVRNIENDPETRSLEVNQRKCRFSDENYLDVHNLYSYNACIVQCRKEKQMNLCNCTSHLIPNTHPMLHCNVSGLECLNDNYEELNNPLAKWSTNKKGIICNCAPLCTDLDIEFIGETKQSKHADFDGDVSTISFALVDLPTERYKRNVVHGKLDLVVSVGGVAGLFVGASVLSFIEIFYFLFVRSCSRFLKKMPPGAGSRWAIGTAILIHLAIYNESGGPTALISVVIAAFSATLAAFNKSSLSHVQMPYIRATQKMDFFCLFLALWMDILALLAACGALARTLSTCLDAMTGGMARIYLLGRNSPENEPWPDVLGVSVVFLLTIMFMLGLENNKIFGLLMSTGVVGMTLILISSSIVRGRLDEWKNSNNIFPKGVFGVLSCAAISTFAFPSELTSTGNYKKLKGLVVVLLVWLFIVLTACCLSTITQFSDKRPFIAVPLFSILDSQDFHKVAPAIACLLVLTCSGAYLELFPEMYNLIVKLTTPEYKILAKQIGFENNDSGSPILAIFIGGSLCAMLAFACPLENLVYILSASHLCSTILRSFYLLYSPFKPKYMESNTSNEASLAYSRLDVSSNPSTSGRRSIWCFNKPKTLSISTSKSRLKKTKHDEELEREWLLLGEPQSPRVTVLEPDAESSILSDQPVSDIECIDRQIITESDSSTDIDAIVDEYRQKIKISTAGPMEKIVRIPTVGSWRMSLCLMVFIVIGILLALCGTIFHSIVLIICGVVDTILFSGAMLLLPKHTIHSASPSALFCGMALIIGSILLGSTLAYSWPAIIFWIFAGLTLYIRCDKWCCQCFERPRSQRLIANVTPNIASIRIPCPPRGPIISSRISGHR